MANRNDVFDDPTLLTRTSVTYNPPTAPTEKSDQQWAHTIGPRQTFSGVGNPNWRVQIFNHVDAGTDYSATQWTRLVKRTASLTFDTRLASWAPGRFVRDTMDGDRAPSFLVPIDSSDLADLDNTARVAFYRKMQSPFSGGTFLGELRETIRMIRKPALALRKGVSDFQVDMARRRLSLVKNAVRSRTPRQLAHDYRRMAGDTWLEYRFGWSPLASDIEGLYQIAVERLQSPDEILPFRVEARGLRNVPKKYVLSDSSIYGAGEYQYFRTSAIRSSVAYGGAVLVRNSSNMPILESLGILPEQFVPTAWELLPYSWAADYFTNIGDVLNAYATAVRLRYVYCYNTRRVEHEQRIDVIPRRDPNFDQGFLTKINSLENGLLSVVGKSVSRSKGNFVPLPSFDFTVKLSTSRGLNLISVADGRLEAARFRNRWRV